MTINWSALLLVAVVTVTAAISIVGLFSLGVVALTTPRTVSSAAVVVRIAGYACLTVAGAIAVYGLYLIVPQFH